MIDYRKILKNQEFRLKFTKLFRFVPSKMYLKAVYRAKTGCKLDLKHPKTFNEKLQWLKLHCIHTEYSELADKVRVREHINRMIGGGHMFPLIGTWKRFEDIPFEELPDRFVLKCNHDSGSVKIIHDKRKLTDKDMKALKKFYKGRLHRNPYCTGREYPYKYIRPCILAEQLMESTDGNGINDYKFFCFDGVPKIMFIATDRATDVKFDFYDMDFNHLDIYNIHPNADRSIEKPVSFDEMKQIAAKLSQGMKFVRVDLYEIDGKIYFGEYTFFHAGGFYLFSPEEWEQKLGDWINIEC